VHERLPSPEQLPRMVYAMPELRIPAQANLVQALFDKAFREGRADKPLLRSDKITLTYAEALDRVNRIAQLLTEDFGLQPGNRVLLRGGNSIAMALAWLGVVQAGLVAVATMPLLRAKELGEIIEKARPALALCDAGLLEELQAAQAQSGTLPAIVPFNLMDAPGSLAVLSAQKDGKFTPCPVRPTTSR
jgi:2-aminobenzoate-CoA ligase